MFANDIDLLVVRLEYIVEISRCSREVPFGTLYTLQHSTPIIPGGTLEQ